MLAAVFRIAGIGLCPFYPVAVLLLLLGAVAALMAAPQWFHNDGLPMADILRQPPLLYHCRYKEQKRTKGKMGSDRNACT